MCGRTTRPSPARPPPPRASPRPFSRREPTRSSSRAQVPLVVAALCATRIHHLFVSCVRCHVLCCVRRVLCCASLGPTVGLPFKVRHHVHVNFDSEMGFQGLPPEWTTLLNAAGISGEVTTLCPPHFLRLSCVVSCVRMCRVVSCVVSCRVVSCRVVSCRVVSCAIGSSSFRLSSFPIRHRNK
jgi:hypothetical protein